jgi:hypothetical protein
MPTHRNALPFIGDAPVRVFSMKESKWLLATGREPPPRSEIAYNSWQIHLCVVNRSFGYWLRLLIWSPPSATFSPVRRPTSPAPVFSTLSGTLDQSLSAERMMALLSIFFAACALLVTATGLYGTFRVDAQEEAGLERLDGLVQPGGRSCMPIQPRHRTG